MRRYRSASEPGDCSARRSVTFLPSVLIVATGLFTLIAGPQTITNLIQHLHGVIPGQATVNEVYGVDPLS